MTTIFGERQQRFLERIAAVSRICTVIQQEFDDVPVPLTHGEVDRGRIVVLDRRQQRRSGNESLHCGEISLARGHEHRVGFVRCDARPVGEFPVATRRQFHRTKEWPAHVKSRCNHARAVSQSRFTVAGDTPSDSAVCSMLSPAK